MQIDRYKTDREVNNSIGNGDAKELICKTIGHELRGTIVEKVQELRSTNW